MRLSRNLSLQEMVKSNTANRLGIDNYPKNEEVLSAMQNWADNIFQPIRDYFKVPVFISSGYRCEELNSAVRGSKTSSHIRGEAGDIDLDRYTHSHIDNADVFNYIKEELDFDQLIWEYGNDEKPSWVHVSYVSKEKNRNEILRIKRVNGKTVTELWK